MDSILLAPLIFLIALIYSTVGFGGGSGYLALLLAAGLSHEAARESALLCNLVVTSVGFYGFARAGHFAPRTVLPFLAASLPYAYLGSRLGLPQGWVVPLVAVCLLAAGWRLAFSPSSDRDVKPPAWKTAWRIGLPAGAVIGLLSGAVGVGGGIFLAPLLFKLRWADSRQIAASSSLFILWNSLSGLLGQTLSRGWTLEAPELLPGLLAALLGGIVGSRLGAMRLTPAVLQRLTAVVVLVAAVQMLGKVL
ncbi:MAG TPA: sulfite exporter TauE/SafE family protein [bacterium]|nr:sulfite exporter TauE/SafE family protein [bacterium]